jgi:alpha-tubulin suppressor-like RCC1 family protein
MKTMYSSNGLLFGLLTWCLSMPVLALAAEFQINLVNTNSDLHLKATTVPANRLVWLEGKQPDSVTNIVQIESLSVVQHDYALTGGTSAAFYRAAMLDTNYEREPIASGQSADAAITTQGTIEIWGDNYAGTFGNGTSPQFYTNNSAAKTVACWVTGITTGTLNDGPGPVLQSSATDWVSLAEGNIHTLALKADGTLWGWGDNTYGELGNTNGGSYSNPVQIGSGQRWNAIFAYAYCNFAIRSDGTLWGWGNNGNSVLGLGPDYTNSSGNLSVANSVLVPAQVGSASNWVKVVTFPGRFSVGIQSDGSLWAWGNTDLPSYVRAGFTSNNVVIPIVSAPAPVGINGPWVDVTTHPTRGGIVVLKADGSLWVTPPVGPNDDAGWADYLSFVQTQEQTPGSLYNILISFGLSPADALTYAVDNIWFENNPAEAGFNFDFASFFQTYSDANLLQPYSVRNGWIMVRGVNALNRDGTIWILGGSTYGGPKDYDWQQLNADSDWAFISYGPVAAKTDGSVWNWDGLANGSVNYANDMVQVVTTQKWLSAKKTTSDVIALDTHSNLWVWGKNNVGQLGLGDITSRLTPTQLPLAGPWLDYAATASATYAIRQGDELWVWGNFNNTGTNVATPVRLNPERPWSAVFAHDDGGTFGMAYALAQDGTLWAMGDNVINDGRGTRSALGTGDTNDTVITNLQQLPGDNWISVSTSDDHALALKTDGSLWGWGGETFDNDSAYEFGLGYVTNAFFATPTLLPGVPGKTWSSISVPDAAGDGFAIGTDGTLWAWGGDNFWSQLGIASLDFLFNTDNWDCTSPNAGGAEAPVFLGGNGTAILSPIQVGGANDWKTVLNTGNDEDAFGYTSEDPDFSVIIYTLGLQTNGTLWVWGKSPFTSVTNQQVYVTPPSHPYPGIPYPQYPYTIGVPQQIGTNTWSYINTETAVTAKGDLYMWGFNQAGQLLQPATWEPLPVNGNIICRLPPPIP